METQRGALRAVTEGATGFDRDPPLPFVIPGKQTNPSPGGWRKDRMRSDDGLERTAAPAVVLAPKGEGLALADGASRIPDLATAHAD